MTDTVTEQTEAPEQEPEQHEQPEAHHPAVREDPRFPEVQQRVTLLRTFVDLAARVAGTEFVPKGLRGKPAAVLACILTGHELGIGPMQALTHIHVVDGRPTQSAELMRALIIRAGHRFSIREKTNDRVTVWGQRSDTGEELAIQWTMADAQRAKLVKKDSAWETYPRAMLMARATSELARDLFADVLGGVSYTPEELGAEVVITEGGYIDVTATDSTPMVADGPVDPTAAWDRVGAMKAREVMEELKRRGLPFAGKEPDLRAALVEALTTDTQETPQDRVAVDVDGVEAATHDGSAPDSPVAAPEDQGAPATAEAPPGAPGATQRPSSRAQAVRQAKAAVDTYTDEQVAEMVAAYEHEPIEDPVHRRGQLIGLIVDDTLGESGKDPAGT